MSGYKNKLLTKIEVVAWLIRAVVLYGLWCLFGYYNRVRIEEVGYSVVANISRVTAPASYSIGHSNKLVEIRQYAPYVAVQAIYRGVDLRLALEMGLKDISPYLLGHNL